jgi:hypothetical protein
MAISPQPPEPQADPVVVSQLHAMGLASDHLRAAIRAGHDEAARCTNNDVATRAGYLRWATPLRYLGDVYGPKGFRRERPGGFEVLRGPNGTFDIAIAPGSHATGTDRMPMTRIERGPMTGQAVLGNRDQMRFDSNIVPLGPRELRQAIARGPLTWLLLHFYDESADELRVELSVPVEFTRKTGTDAERGTVTRFEPRLILPPIPLGENAEIEDQDDDDEIDIPVDRRR